MPANDSLVGDGLCLSPFEEMKARADAQEKMFQRLWDDLLDDYFEARDECNRLRAILYGQQRPDAAAHSATVGEQGCADGKAET